ncbi:LolA family protein [Chitinophaga sp. ARDCPP14]|uniref:LolA family protein n=1 Tax=Chitinophaga sp. ARDCPP14 TaxID=3391139 RepID=UPI003F5242F6
MMNTKRIALLLLVIFSGIITQAQSLEDIVNKNVAALGGADKLKTLKTQYAEGTMEMQGMNFPFKRWVLQDKAMRLEFTAMGTTNIQVLTDAGGWMQMPVMGKTNPEDMDSATIKALGKQLDLTGDFYRYNEKGNKLELLPADTVNGAKLAKVKVTYTNGNATTCFVDPVTGNVLRTSNSLEIQGQQMDLVTDISNFLKTADGYNYGTAISQEPVGIKISITKLENNVPVDESIFKKP